MQCYRPYLSQEDINMVKVLIKKQNHHLITPEIRKAIASGNLQGDLKEGLMDLN